MTFKQACKLYPHRYTMDHIPAWAKKRAPNGKYYAPQYASDDEWFDRTEFSQSMFDQECPRSPFCMSFGQTWPLGYWLDVPYTVPNPRKHNTRLSDSTLYDEVCTVCGATDLGHGLDLPCPGKKG